MPAAAILREGPDVPVAEAVRTDLVLREWSVVVDSFASRMFEAEQWARMKRPAILAFVPGHEEDRQRCLLRLRQLMEAGVLPIVICPQEIRLPDWIYDKGVQSVVPTGYHGYDRLFEDIFRALLGPMPGWLDVRLRPSQLLRPTGVSWWNEDVYVADERYEHVVRIGPVDTQVVIPGLYEPHHIHLDREILYVANKAADEILIAEIMDGMAARVQSVTECAGAIKRPHDVRCHHYLFAVADTDHHRVLIAPQCARLEDANWQEVRPHRPLHAPCGLHADGAALWVADTFNHRIVAFTHQGAELGEFGVYGQGNDEFRYPVSVYSWGDYLFVGDEETARLQVYRKEVGAAEIDLVPHLSSFAAPWVLQPFGLSVNRENKLAIGDRKQKCVWLIDLASALQQGSLSEG